MKQTAIEWLMQTLEQNNIIDLDCIDSDKYYTIIEKAKAMEKEQIMDAYWEGGQDIPVNEKQCDIYYNETYEQSKQG